MTPTELVIREFLDCMRKNVTGIISTSRSEDQTQLAGGNLADHPDDSAEQPVSNFLEKLWLSKPEPLFKESKCRNCSFWMDPGRLASYGLCYRLVLAYSDLLTTVEHMVSGEPHTPLYTPEDFLCAHFTPRPFGGAEDPASSSAQLFFLTRVVEEYCIPVEAELSVSSGSAGDGNVR